MFLCPLCSYGLLHSAQLQHSITTYNRTVYPSPKQSTAVNKSLGYPVVDYHVVGASAELSPGILSTVAATVLSTVGATAVNSAEVIKTTQDSFGDVLLWVGASPQFLTNPNALWIWSWDELSTSEKVIAHSSNASYSSNWTSMAFQKHFIYPNNSSGDANYTIQVHSLCPSQHCP